MALKELKKHDAGDVNLAKVQEYTKQFVDQFNKIVLDGIYLTDITVSTTTTLVPHKLARAFQGWQLLDLQGDARVWRDTTSTADETKYLPLKASSSVTVSLWVF